MTGASQHGNRQSLIGVPQVAAAVVAAGARLKLVSPVDLLDPAAGFEFLEQAVALFVYVAVDVVCDLPRGVAETDPLVVGDRSDPEGPA